MATKSIFAAELLLCAAQVVATSTFAQSSKASDAAKARSDPLMSATQQSSAVLMNVSPQSFATQAAVMGKAEVELAQLALDKSKNASVRAYAQRMVEDHTATNANLKKLASQENITLPSALDAQHQAVKQKLSGLRGDDFDRQYTKEMANGHDKAVALFQSAMQSPQMPQEFKEFAATALSTLEDHREQAQQLVNKTHS
jgi:putative membrane protein